MWGAECNIMWMCVLNMQHMLFFNSWINFKLMNMRNIFFYLFNNNRNINNSILQDHDNWFVIRKINILLWVCKTGKVHILHARHTFSQTSHFSRLIWNSRLTKFLTVSSGWRHLIDEKPRFYFHLWLKK